MITKLEQAKSYSVVTLFDDDHKHIGSITYQRKIHKFESENDYKMLVTEDKTYGDKAIIELFNYLKGVRV
jgi:hypothetical protein